MMEFHCNAHHLYFHSAQRHVTSWLLSTNFFKVVLLKAIQACGVEKVQQWLYSQSVISPSNAYTKMTGIPWDVNSLMSDQTHRAPLGGIPNMLRNPFSHEQTHMNFLMQNSAVLHGHLVLVSILNFFHIFFIWCFLLFAPHKSGFTLKGI